MVRVEVEEGEADNVTTVGRPVTFLASVRVLGEVVGPAEEGMEVAGVEGERATVVVRRDTFRGNVLREEADLVVVAMEEEGMAGVLGEVEEQEEVTILGVMDREVEGMVVVVVVAMGGGDMKIGKEGRTRHNISQRCVWA